MGTSIAWALARGDRVGRSRRLSWQGPICGMIERFWARRGLYKYGDHARPCVVDARDARNADEAINGQINARRPAVMAPVSAGPHSRPGRTEQSFGAFIGWAQPVAGNSPTSAVSYSFGTAEATSTGITPQIAGSAMRQVATDRSAPGARAVPPGAGRDCDHHVDVAGSRPHLRGCHLDAGLVVGRRAGPGSRRPASPG
jgi:hypothetical protein